MLLAEPLTDRVIGLAIEVHRDERHPYRSAADLQCAASGGWPPPLRGVAPPDAHTLSLRDHRVLRTCSVLKKSQPRATPGRGLCQSGWPEIPSP